MILISAFYAYDQFSIIDITSFAVFTFAAFLILFLVIYLLVLKFINKKIERAKQLIFFPLVFALVANLPAYFIIWKNTPEFYGRGEANLFTMGFITCGLIFGLFWAWINKMKGQRKAR